MPGLDINWFREDKGHNPNIIRESLKKRYKDPKLVDEIIEKDQQWRKCKKFIYMFSKILTRYVKERMECYRIRNKIKKES